MSLSSMSSSELVWTQ